MKVTVKGDLLTKTLRRSLLTNTPINPAHALVKIEAKKGAGKEPSSLTFTSTAGVLSLNTSIVAEVAEGGVIAVNARALFTASGAMPEGDIVLSSDATRVRLKGSSGRAWSGATADPTTIQPTPEPKGAEWLRAPVELLRTAIERVGYVTGNVEKFQEARAGIRIEATADKLTAIAVGQYMFAVIEQESKALGLKTDKWIGLLPTQALPAIADVLAEAVDMKSETVELYVDQHQLYVNGPATLFVASLPVGDYPPWEMVFKNFPTKSVCTVPRLALMESIKACEATGSKLDPGAMIHISRRAFELFREEADSDFRDAVPLVEMQEGTDLTLKCGMYDLLSLLKGADGDAELFFDSEGRTLLMRAGSYRAVCSLLATKPPEPPERPAEPDPKGKK